MTSGTYIGKKVHEAHAKLERMGESGGGHRRASKKVKKQVRETGLGEVVMVSVALVSSRGANDLQRYRLPASPTRTVPPVSGLGIPTP